MSGKREEKEMGEAKFKPIYSGPNCIGICVCGHSWEEHHLGMVLNEEYYEATQEAYFPQECEHYGSNELGGLDAKGKSHCSGYRDRGRKNKKQGKKPKDR